ncbi:hypothetical protein RYH80_06385 [Halobaculum sp. MBLA0147]
MAHSRTPAESEAGTPLDGSAGPLTRAAARILRHLREWPARYVAMRTGRD